MRLSPSLRSGDKLRIRRTKTLSHSYRNILFIFLFFFQGTVPPSAQAIVKSILEKPNRRRVFPSELRSFAITLHYYNEKAYNYVREIFIKCLPHPKTLSK